MKHSVKITILLLLMFFVAQLIGLLVINSYAPQTKQVTNEQGELVNITTYNLPFGTDPPEDISPKTSLLSIIIAIFIAVSLMFILMKYKAELFLRLWFFFVVTLALAITINAALLHFFIPPYISLIIALPFSFLKIFKRNIIIHNITELLIYPGIAAIFVPLLNVWTIILLLILISVYDMYAVWHSGIMQKMAKYQIQQLRIFSGFFVPYLGKKESELVKKFRANAKSVKNKKIKVSVAILGGGDVVFPIILAGVVLRALGPIQALIISIGATLALALLFYYSEKGKFYPAMPFISTGCFIALVVAYLI